MKTLTAPRREKLPGMDADGVAARLRPALADLVALSLHSKQAHWNVTGPQFSPLHELFDRMAGEHRGWYDAVAERSLALGVPADGRLGTVAAETGTADLPEGALPGPRAVELLLERVEVASGRMRRDLDRLGDLDPVTQDLVIGIVEGLEKQAWMLRVQRS